MRRFLTLAFAVFAAAMLLAAPASARRAWCRTDPVISVNGTQYAFEVAGEVDQEVPEVDGPIKWKFHLREGDDYALISEYDEFGFGEEITLIYDIGASQLRYAEVKIPVKNSVVSEIPFYVYRNGVLVDGNVHGDQWSGNYYFGGI